MTEIKAFLVLLLYSGIFNFSHENLRFIVVLDPRGCWKRDFYSVMINERFNVLLIALRFGNIQNSVERNEKEPVKYILEFTLFVKNSQDEYSLRANVMIDEMLVAFHGSCKFKIIN